MTTVLVIGATGAMGSAVVEGILRDIPNAVVHAFTRDLNSPQAATLKSISPDRVELVHGDLDDRDSVEKAMAGVDAVFCNTNFWAGKTVKGERDHGLLALAVAEEAGVEHFIYSSLDPVTRLSGGKLSVSHYDSKASVEAEIDWRRSEEFMSQEEDGWYSNHVSVLVTCPYYENFQDFFLPKDATLSDGRTGKVFQGPLSGDGNWQMIALSDLAGFATLMLSDRAGWGGRTLRVASEELPMKDVAATFESVTGIPCEYAPISDAEFLASGPPLAHDPLNNMVMYREGYFEPRDYESLRRLRPQLETLETWLKKTGWNGEHVDFRKEAVTG